MRTLLLAQNLTKCYVPDVAALRDVSLRVEEGRFLGLIGPNGAGKSTLLNILGGFLQATDGHVERIPRLIGWCPQQTVVDWSLTVIENVMMPARLFGLSRRAARSAAEEALELLGLRTSAKTTAETLSGGQLQRVQIARALCISPDLVLLDEPTTGLDVEGQESLWTHLRQRRTQGLGGLISSHDLDALERECDSFLFLRNGRTARYFDRSELDAESMSVFEVRPLDEAAVDALRTLAASVGRAPNLDGSLWLVGAELPDNVDERSLAVERRQLSLRAAYKTVGLADTK